MIDYALIQNNFPPTNDKDIFDLLQFIKQKPFEKDSWNIIKLTYKKLEEYFLQPIENQGNNNQRQALANILGHLISRIDLCNTNEIKSEFPTELTMFYMKRRARRFLKELGTKDKEIYLKIAKNIILNTDKTTPQINPNSQFALSFILFHNSLRLQYHNSRTGYQWKKGYHLHQKEEYLPDYWDENFEFVQSLCQKNDLPEEIYEFAIKIYRRNEWQVPEISENLLIKFFNASSVWLRKVALQKTYEIFIYKNISPQLYAGLWLYRSPFVQKKMQEIERNRVKYEAEYLRNFADILSKYTFSALKSGNANKRILKSIEYLQQNNKQVLDKFDWLPLARTLFASPIKSLKNIAFDAMKNTKFEDAFYWLSAWVNAKERDKDKDFDEYERFVDIFYGKCPKNVGRDTIKVYIFSSQFFFVEFGWKMSLKNGNQWNYYQIWSKITNNYASEKYLNALKNTLLSPSGRIAFDRYYKYYSYNLGYLSGTPLSYIFEYGEDKMQKMFVTQYLSNLISSFGYYISTLMQLPEKPKEAILKAFWEEMQKDGKPKNLFTYYWYTQQAFNQAETNDFLLNFLEEIFTKVNLSKESWQNIGQEIFNFPKTLARLLTFLERLEDNDFRVQTLLKGIKLYQIISNAQVIPQKYLQIALSKLNWEDVLQITAETNDENWQLLQTLIYPILEKKQQEKGFWKGLLEKVITGENRQLGVRLLDNELFFNLFLKQTDIALIDIQEPEYEDFLLQWVDKNPQYFAMESQELFKLCMHKIPAVRQWGLKKAENLGITLSFALRLIESDMPDMVHLAENYFQNIPTKTPQETESVLALFDSPNKNARSFALQYARKRKENFGNNAFILECLSEHSDTIVQTFVAQEIEQLPENQLQKLTNTFVSRFDKEVLRMKNRNRKAKESIKNRIENTILTTDTQTLLELARKGTQSDKEWAIEQLTKKALAGEEIEGFLLKN